jgi:hypothetical protein
MLEEAPNRGSRSDFNRMEGSYEEVRTNSYHTHSPQISPLAPSYGTASSFTDMGSPAMSNSSSAMDEWCSSFASPQYPTPQHHFAYYTPQPAYSPSCKLGNDESPSGVPIFQPRPFSVWNKALLLRSPSFESPSPLSFSSSSQSSSPTSSSSSSSYYPGDYLSVASSPVSWPLSFGTTPPAFPETSSSAITGAGNHVDQRPGALPGVNKDISENSGGEKLPPYATIIYEALMSVPEKKMVLADIYNHFRRRYPGRAARDEGWKNSIRHNLSMNGVSFQRTL